MRSTHSPHTDHQSQPIAAPTSVIGLKHELIRKAIHIVFTSSLIGALYLSFATMCIIIAALLLCLLLFERIRRGRNISTMRMRGILRQIGLFDVLRTHESESYTGATFMLIAMGICILIFPIHIFVLSFLVLGWADTAAALVGRNFAKHAIADGKSLEGSAAFFCTAVLINSLYIAIMAYHDVFMIIGTIAAAFATFAEVYSQNYKIDDNLAVPVVFGGVFYTLSLYFYSLFI